MKYFKDYGHGYAGARGNWKPKGVVIHNTAGNGDTALSYFTTFIPTRVARGEMNLGYTHYYIDAKDVVQVADTRDGAWHTANADGNMNYVGYEVCNSYGPEKDFLANEQATFKQVAEDMKFWGLEPNRNTVRLHREFFNTACPHRSWDLHGKDVNKVKDYFISQIKKYMTSTPKPQPTIEYRGHVQNIGWQTKLAKNGETAGTTGKGLRLEALEYNPKGFTLDAEAHIQNMGWVKQKNNRIGTTGKGLRMEAIKFIPKGLPAGKKLMGRVHIQDEDGDGWTPWTVCDGVVTLGTAGEGKRIEAIQLKVV